MDGAREGSVDERCGLITTVTKRSADLADLNVKSLR